METKNTTSSEAIQMNLQCTDILNRYLPKDYRKRIAEKVGCHPNSVSLVRKKLEQNEAINLKTEIEFSIFKAILNEVKKQKAAQRSHTSSELLRKAS